MKMKRSEATRMIDGVRKMLADNWCAEDIEHWMEQYHQVPPLKACTGDAHSNPYIDNCGICCPRWGWVGEKVEVT